MLNSEERISSLCQRFLTHQPHYIGYKIITKVLVERLKKVMLDIISPSQSAFIGGRQITDLVLVANEIVEEYQSKKKKGWILKLDLEKAFDRVDWNFLEEILMIKGFNSKWISWINGALEILNIQFLLMLDQERELKHLEE